MWRRWSGFICPWGRPGDSSEGGGKKEIQGKGPGRTENTQWNRRQEKSGERAGMGVERLTGHGPETLRTTGYCGTTVLATVVLMVAALP